MDARIARLEKLGLRPAATYEARGGWGQKPLWRRVRDTAIASPGKAAVIDEAGAWSYGELWDQAELYAAAMRASGLEKRDIVLVQLPNWREFVAIAVAAEATGVVFSFCPIQWGLRETTRALELIQPRLWFTTAAPRAGDSRGDLIREALSLSRSAARPVLLRSSPEPQTQGCADFLSLAAQYRWGEKDGASGRDPLEIAVTSGSTGDPKGVLHVHDSALATVQSTIRRQGITADDVIHLAIPVGHTFGYFYGVRCAMQATATLVLQERWDAAKMLELVSRHRATVSLGPSAFVLDLLQHAEQAGDALKRVWLFTHSGDSLPAPTARRAQTALPFRISRALGMTEFGHTTSTDAQTDPERSIDSLGTPQPEMELKIVDGESKAVARGVEGRILVRGPFVFAGYLLPDRLNEDVLDADGWFDTGDLGYLDEGGHLHMTGRLKNVIRRGAETIPVSVLEDVISSMPQVAHAVVVGMPDERMGEMPVACVQVRDGSTLTMQELTGAFEANGVTKKFWPTQMQLFTSWPIGATGKIDRKMIVEQLMQGNA